MNNIPSRQERTFFSFTQEACTLPFLEAQHVIHTCTPLKGLPCMLSSAAKSSMEISTLTSLYVCMVETNSWAGSSGSAVTPGTVSSDLQPLNDRAGTIDCTTLETDSKPELYITEEIKQIYLQNHVVYIYCSTVLCCYMTGETIFNLIITDRIWGKSTVTENIWNWWFYASLEVFEGVKILEQISHQYPCAPAAQDIC